MAGYKPKGHGKSKFTEPVIFKEARPAVHLSRFVHRIIKLETPQPLPQDYTFHALPDACTYMIFDLHQPDVTGVTRLRVNSEEFNLGRTFSYINVRLFPGIWQHEREPTSFGQLTKTYEGNLPLLEVSHKLDDVSFEQQCEIICRLIDQLIALKFMAANPLVENIMRGLDDINSVADMAQIAQISARQLQRNLKASTGFTPHDFLKILRLQKSLGGDRHDGYADQSHFIRSFRHATGYTPGQHEKKYDV